MSELFFMYIYKTLLDRHYLIGSSVYFSYMGVHADFNFTKYLLTVVLLIPQYYVGKLIHNKVMKYIYYFYLILMIIPSTSQCALVNYPWNYLVLVCLYWAMIAVSFVVLQKIEIRNFQTTKRNVLTKDNKINKALYIIGIISSMYLFAKYFNGMYTSILKTYDTRVNFRTFSTSFDTYLISWAGVVFLPWSFIIALYNKQYRKVAIIEGATFLLFLSDGQKMWLFFGLFFIFVYMFYRKGNILRWFLLFSCALILISDVIFLTNGDYTISSIFDRIYLAPSEVTLYYIDFFQDNEPLYLSESIMRWCISSPYNKKIPVIIADLYWTAASYHSCTIGLLGDAIANFGVIGVILYPWMMGLLAMIAKCLWGELPEFVVICLTFIFVYESGNLSFFTFLLTGGFVFYILIFCSYKIKFTIGKPKKLYCADSQ